MVTKDYEFAFIDVGRSDYYELIYLIVMRVETCYCWCNDIKMAQLPHMTR